MATENQNVEELIQGMMSFLDDSSEETQLEEQDESKNPLCWAVKAIIKVIPTSTPPPTSKEYHKMAEHYALYGKEFLDLPTDINCHQPTDGACYGEMSSIRSPLTKAAPSPGFPVRMIKSMNQLAATNIPQQQFLVNQTNYCSYPLLPAQPLVYSNPFLMTQYCNTFVNETQINTSLIQQQQFMAAGIHERLVHAQMLQQVQTNQTAGLSSLYFPEGRTGSNCSMKCKHELVKFGPTYGSDVTASVKENSTKDSRF